MPLLVLIFLPSASGDGYNPADDARPIRWYDQNVSDVSRRYESWLCKNSARYHRTRNFGLCGDAEGKKNGKICLPLGTTTKSDFVFTQ